MQPKHEQIGLANLYLGDCREILPSLQADVLITDPVWPNCPTGLLAGSDRPKALMRETMMVMPSVRRAVIDMRHDSDPRFLSSIPLDFFRIQILPYVMPGYIGRKLGGDEIAYCFGTPVPSAPGRRVIPGYGPKVQPGQRQANGHPCSRAIAHFKFLVGWNSDPHEVIIDPFMGSGTTGSAATSMGRPFVGIEIDPVYFDLACQNIEDAQRQKQIEFDPACHLDVDY